MEPTNRVIYYSRNSIAGTSDDIGSSMRRLLAQARTHNVKCGVTGVLMFNRACFAQVLEGPKEAVTRTFQRIVLDERHREVVLLSNGAVNERVFPHWSMAYVGESVQDAGQFGYIAQQTGFDPIGMTGDALLRTLKDLVRGAE